MTSTGTETHVDEANTPSRRERARAATMAEIKQTALELMRQQGNTDVRFTDIARVMGLTPPALYRYYADRDEPAGSMSIYPDHVAGCLGAVGSLAALVGRSRRVNEGMHLEVAQVETVVGMLGDLMAAEAVEAGSVVPMGNRNEAGSPWGLYRCAGDEEWVAITCRDDTDWRGLVAAMGDPEWARDAALATPDRRRAHADDVDERIRQWTAAQSKDVVAATCQREGVPAAPMLTGAEMTTDPQYVARRFAVQIEQPGVGPLVLDGPAFRGEHMVGPDIRPAPDLGEHTRSIARDLLGHDDAEIDRLLAAGILETTPPVG